MPKGKQCVLYDRECIDCGECNYCDLYKNKICDNCGKCIEDTGEYRIFTLNELYRKMDEQTKLKEEDDWTEDMEVDPDDDSDNDLEYGLEDNSDDYLEDNMEDGMGDVLKDSFEDDPDEDLNDDSDENSDDDLYACPEGNLEDNSGRGPDK